MLFGFKDQFAPLILSGRKQGTIRLPRADGKVAQPGEQCHLYTGLRTDKAKLLARPACLFSTNVYLSRHALAHDNVPSHLLGQWFGPAGPSTAMGMKNYFAYRDGFADWEELAQWFKLHPQRVLPARWTVWEPLV